MHIMEGFLPVFWCLVWFAVSIPVIAYGVYKLNKLVKEKREILPLLAVAGAFIFVLSSLKMPSVTGSCSHPTGTGIAAIIFGPAITAVLSTNCTYLSSSLPRSWRAYDSWSKCILHGHRGSCGVIPDL